MRDNPNLTNPDSDLKLNKPELKIDVNREKVASVGSSVDEVGRAVETMFGGRNVTRFKMGTEQYDVIVQLEEGSRRTPTDLSNVFVRGANDQMIQLQNLATVTETVAAKAPSEPSVASRIFIGLLMSGYSWIRFPVAFNVPLRY